MSHLTHIKARIKKFSLLVRIGMGLLRFFIILLSALFLYCLIDYSFILSPVIRTLFLSSTILCGIIWAITFNFNPAYELENKLKIFNGKLFASLSNYPSILGYSEQLINKIREQTAQLLESINLIPQIKRNLTPLFLPFTISCLSIIICLAFIPSPKFTWIKRFFWHNDFFTLSVEPGNKKVFYGDTIEIKIKPEGITPSKILLFIKAGSRGSQLPIYDEKHTLYKIQKGFQTRLKVTEDISYHATLGIVSTTPCKISVIVPPSITEFKLIYTYPAYTKIPEFTSISPEIAALYETKISLSAISNVELKSATINLNSSSIICKVEGKKLKADFLVTKADSYNISMLAENGFSNETSFYPIKTWNDAPPQVNITFPAMDIEMPPTMKIPLVFQAKDDYGLSYAKLIWSSQQPITWLLHSVTDTSISYEWNLSQITSMGEVITYWIEVFDNDPFKGPKLAKSKEFKIYFPTVEDIYKQVSSEIAQTQTQTVHELEELSENLNAIGKQMEDIVANMEQNKTKQVDWNDKQAIEKLLQKEKEIEERLNNLSKNLDELYKKTENTVFMLDEETIQKIKQLQKLLSELKLPELQTAIEKLQEAINKDPNLLKEALKNFKLNQEELKNRIENTIALLEKFKQEQALKSLADRASELQKWQSDINERTTSGDSLAQLAKEEESLNKDLAQLNEDIKKSSEQLKQFSKELNQESARASNIQQKLNQISNNLSRGQKPSKAQQEVSNDLSSLASNLYSLHQKMIDDEKSKITKELQKLRDEFLFLSFKEEGLEGTPLDIAYEQSALIKGAKNAAQDLKALSQTSALIPTNLGQYVSDAIASMEKLQYKSEELAKSSTPNTRNQIANTQTQAMTSLNKTVAGLIEAENVVQSSSCPCGLPFLMNQLAQLTQRQQNLNMLMQSLIPLSFGSSEMQQQLSQLMQEQQAISEALKQVADGLKGRTLGDLGGAAQEMEKIAKDLEKGITQEIIERQNKVLEHLLDAQKSIYTKKYSRQRISEPGENFLSLPSPPSPKLSTKYGISQKEIIEALKQDYPKEYEQLIKAYFDAISK